MIENIKDRAISVWLDNGKIFTFKADTVVYDQNEHIYNFYRNGIKIGYFVGECVEWIAPK